MKNFKFGYVARLLAGAGLASLGLGASLSHAAAAPAQPLVLVGSQVPDQILPGDSATYSVTISEKALGVIEDSRVCLNLPAGALASFSDPVQVKGEDGSPSKVMTLTITTQPSTPPGVYPFIVTRQNQGNGIQISATGTLVIGAHVSMISYNPPVILSIQMLPDRTAQILCSGTSGGTYWLQASTTLSPPAWSNIATNSADANNLLNFVDTQAPTFPMRFYRAAIAH